MAPARIVGFLASPFHNFLEFHSSRVKNICFTRSFESSLCINILMLLRRCFTTVSTKSLPNALATVFSMHSSISNPSTSDFKSTYETITRKSGNKCRMNTGKATKISLSFWLPPTSFKIEIWLMYESKYCVRFKTAFWPKMLGFGALEMQGYCFLPGFPPILWPDVVDIFIVDLSWKLHNWLVCPSDPCLASLRGSNLTSV